MEDQKPPIRNWRTPSTYSTSKTIPGQSLIPAELLKRHLAGTLPDIDKSSKYEYHYDENGEQIGEPLPIEMHELHKLALALRKKQFEEENVRRAERAKKYRDQLIEEYKAEQAKSATANFPEESKKGEGKAMGSTSPDPL